MRRRRISSESRDVAEGIEATENFIAAGVLDEAVDIAIGVADFLAWRSTLRRLSFARDVRAALPTTHPDYKLFADHEAQALLVLGFTGSAVERYIELVNDHRRLVTAEPGRADYQRDLSVSLNKLGDVLGALGEGEQARQHYDESLGIGPPSRSSRFRPVRGPGSRNRGAAAVRGHHARLRAQRGASRGPHHPR